jgi:hypothetical protein
MCRICPCFPLRPQAVLVIRVSGWGCWGKFNRNVEEGFVIELRELTRMRAACSVCAASVRVFCVFLGFPLRPQAVLVIRVGGLGRWGKFNRYVEEGFVRELRELTRMRAARSVCAASVRVFC